MSGAIAQRLKEFLLYEKLSQKEFCKITGFNQSSLSTFLNGKTTPKIELIEALAKHFSGLDIGWLITGEGQMLKQPYMNGGSEKEETGPISRKQIIDLLQKRVNELEREIARKDPELARELGIE